MRDTHTDPLRTIPELPAILEKIVRNCRPLRVLLFGSAGRGEAREGSDLDLFVIVADGVDPRAVASAIQRDLTDCLTPVDVVVATRSLVELHGADPGYIYATILREGRDLLAA